MSAHYTKTSHFRQPHIFSSVQGKPTKITALVHWPKKADKIALIFVGLVLADENKVPFSSA
jgi:hypothetical protein